MRLIGIISMFILIGLAAQAQSDYREIIRKNNQQPFEVIVARVEDYFKNKDKGRGSGYKQFKRWAFYNERRLDENGYLQNVPARVLDEFLTYRNYRSLAPELNFDCAWETLGGTAYERVSSGHNGGLGRVNCIVPDPDDSDIIYVGTPAGGLWRTDNGGGWNPADPSASNWDPLTDGLPAIGVSGIAVDPTSPVNNRILYILTGDGDGQDTPSIGVLKSFDGGETWFQTGLSWSAIDQVFGYKLVMHPTDPNTLYAATTQGIFQTTDGGLTWTNQQPGWFFDIEFQPGSATTMYAVTASTFWRTTDGGGDWDPINGAGCAITGLGVRMAIGVTPADANIVYVLVGGVLTDGMGNPIAGTFRGLYRSSDGGNCFTLQSTTPNILNSAIDGSETRQQATYDLAIAVSPIDENQVHTGGINTWRSNDAGVSWSITSHWFEPSAGAGNYNHADIHALDYIGNTLYAGTDGGIYESNNHADDWVNISQGLRITQFYRIGAFTDDGSDYVMGGAQDNGLNHFEDMGAGFGNINHWEGADGFECSPDVASDLVFGATQRGCMVRYAYPGGSVDALTVFPGDSCGGSWLTPHFFDATNDVIWAGYQDVWNSTDDGDNWTNISNGAIGGGLADHMAMAPSDDNVIYVSKNGSIFRTVDGGASWANITANLFTTGQVITYFTIDPNDADRLWVTLGGFSAGNKVFFRDIGSDASWTNVTGNLPNLPANCIVYENGSNDGLYIGLDVGVYYRDINTAEWVLFSNALPNVIINELEINYSTGKIYAGTYGRGMWCSDLISSCSELCLDCPNFTNFHSQPNTYATEDCITSSAVVYEEAEVNYEAQNYIHLQENFHVQTYFDAVFHGAIADCDLAGGSLRIANLRKLPGYYVGELAALSTGEAEVITPAADRTLPTTTHAFPNPSSGIVNMELDMEQQGSVSIHLYSMIGKRLLTLERGTILEEGRALRTYDLGDLPNGTYILEVVIDGKQQAQPFVISR
jgi:photosystem II stability/assembly factor-like uncharacterized protein